MPLADEGADWVDEFMRRRADALSDHDAIEAKSVTDPLAVNTDLAVYSPSQRFRAWSSILKAVREEIVGRGSSLAIENDSIAMDSFTGLVSALCDRNPAWGIQPSRVNELVPLLREEFYGFGPLAPYIALDGVEEIICNRHDRVFVIVKGEKRRLDPSPFHSDKEVVDFLNRIFAAQGRELNLANPAEDGQLPDGSRIHAEIPPLSVLGPAFAIRTFNPRPFTMEEYLETEMFTQEFLDALKSWIASQFNIVVSGGTASGKTSLLNAVGALIPSDDRLIVIENTKELQIETEDTVYIQSIMRGAKEGKSDSQSITIRDGIRYALRLRPDRIIVGEVRSAEAFDLLQAMNTGHDGSLTTLHANSGQDAIARLEGLAAAAGELPLVALQDLIARTIDIVIQVGRFRGTPYRKILEAWQVLHPLQVPSDVRTELDALLESGTAMRVRDHLVMVPLFMLDGRGTLLRQSEPLPIIGRRPLCVDSPGASPLRPG